MLSRQEKSTKQLVEVLGLVQSTSGLPIPPADRAPTHSPLCLWLGRPLGDLVGFRRQTNGDPSGSVDKELFTSFLNPKNVFPVVALLGLVLRSVLNHQGTRISLNLLIFDKCLPLTY